MTEQIYHLGVKAIVRRPDGLVLRLQSKEFDRFFWGLPGGRVRVGEDCLTALHREILEETGLTPVSLIPLETVVTPLRVKQTDIHLIFWYALCDLDHNPVITLAPEFTTYEWASWDVIAAEFAARQIPVPARI